MFLAFIQDPAAYGDALGFRNAFLRSVGEFNQYGLALGNPKYQVPDELAVQLFGFKVPWPVVATFA